MRWGFVEVEFIGLGQRAVLGVGCLMLRRVGMIRFRNSGVGVVALMNPGSGGFSLR